MTGGSLRGHSIRESMEIYGIPSWGQDFFDINLQGRLEVYPSGKLGPKTDLLSLVAGLQDRGLRTPILIRFPDILAKRIETLVTAFDSAILASGYKGKFRGVYPIKVNQQRHVVEEVVALGSIAKIGLEAGSKPELLIALAELETPDALLICNGYKDRAYVETALLAQQLGRYPVLVIDRFPEVELIIKTSIELNIRPHIGIRAKLSARSSGRWEASSGARSKFGLTPDEIAQTLERLRADDMLECLELLHFHIGSQITTIRAHRDALREASRIFVGLHELGAKPRMLDVGGGLAVDYDGSQTNFHSSKNYSAQEYANDVVSEIKNTCDEEGIDHPDIVTESGRWMTAHHSVLIFDVLGVDEVGVDPQPGIANQDDARVIQNMSAIWRNISRKNILESYHDAIQLREDATTFFSLGQLRLEDRARAERLFYSCAKKIQRTALELDTLPEELEELERGLADIYFGNLSIFQSAPDHWAVKQLFPIVPIHRLDEKPTRRGVFADLTCDSDGKIDQFIDQRDVKDVLELHSFQDEPYFIGLFLVGAYQEILGDLHNLFGDTDAVHVRLDVDGEVTIEHVVEGDAISEVMAYVQYEQIALVEKFRKISETALKKGDITIEDSERLKRHFSDGLSDYTYLKRNL
ncbi:biosynthetic arginine decarboxylase [Myxococcota bacterium]|nr:biosynthetic arginine decarboxylase [Myxococcota bacterium]